MQHRSTVLVVSDDLGLSDEVGDWLEEAGLEVLLCPGPGSRGCTGLAGRQCALERAADAIVMDVHPTGGSFRDASRPTELARHYSISGNPVLVLTDDGGQLEQLGTIGAATLGRFADRQQVTETVQELVAQGRLAQEHLPKRV